MWAGFPWRSKHARVVRQRSEPCRCQQMGRTSPRRDVSPCKIDVSKIMVLQNALILSDLARDRIAPDFTIRHPVRPIVALQRRMRFSARLAGFCRGRWHQRRARRAELASFSVLVSNLDFRVPRLRPNRRTGADRAVRQRQRGHPRGSESRPGLLPRSWPSTFWSRCGPGLLNVHLCPGPGSVEARATVA